MEQAALMSVGLADNARPDALPEELTFYSRYEWCLDPRLPIRDALRHLREECAELTKSAADWQVQELAINIHLLASAVLNVADERLRGHGLRLPRQLSNTWPAHLAGRVVAALTNLNPRQRSRLRSWRGRWAEALDEYLRCFVRLSCSSASVIARASMQLAGMAAHPPDAIADEVIGIPSPFRRLDLTHHDVLALGQLLMQRVPSHDQPLVLVGLRTSGTYFAPLLRAQLRSSGYRTASVVTVQPDKGPGSAERNELRHHAQGGSIAIILDDPPHSGGAVLKGVTIVRQAGFPVDRIMVLVPTRSAPRHAMRALPKAMVITLPAEAWHKTALLRPDVARQRLAGYLAPGAPATLTLERTARCLEFEAGMKTRSPHDRGERLKRIFVIRSSEPANERFVLAKSVGWGWLGYHAFLAGQRLAGLVPHIIGLRDGILYMEWQPPEASGPVGRQVLLDVAADYVAARVRQLPLPDGVRYANDRYRAGNRVGILAKSLSQAYGRMITCHLMRPCFETELAVPCPCPTLIDGKMEPEEWIIGTGGPLKADFEHHGMGKGELNHSDPALDLAQTLLGLEATPGEEKRLIQRYISASDDRDVERRLFLAKLLAGCWVMDKVQQQFFDGVQDATRQRQLHERYMAAWNFLTLATTCRNGHLRSATPAASWSPPYVVLDVDGVIDRRVFGFPCSTAASIKALSLLQGHGFTIAINTARSLPEVKTYCDAYGLAGGIAEHGACLWDGVAGVERVLISEAAAAQLRLLADRLAGLPGIFIDARHCYSVRAFTYGKPSSRLLSSRTTGAATLPLPQLLIAELMAEPAFDRLAFHHTSIDTTIVTRETDKGTAMRQLSRSLLMPGARVVAIGDSESDLEMFRQAAESHAPAHIHCAGEAQLLGCRVASRQQQSGFLDIARSLIHPDGGRCPACLAAERLAAADDPLWAAVLEAADRPLARNLMTAVRTRGAVRAMFRS